MKEKVERLRRLPINNKVKTVRGYVPNALISHPQPNQAPTLTDEVLPAHLLPPKASRMSKLVALGHTTGMVRV